MAVLRGAVILGFAGLILLRPLATGADPPAVQPPHIAVAVRRAARDVPAWEVSRGGLPRGYYLIAQLTKKYFPPADWQTICAVGIAESAGLPAEVGDKDTPVPSVGLFQVRLVHRAMLERLTGSTNPAVWTTWLKVADNNARAARIIFDSAGGLRNWGAFTNGRWRLFEGAARESLEAVNQ